MGINFIDIYCNRAEDEQDWIVLMHIECSEEVIVHTMGWSIGCHPINIAVSGMKAWGNTVHESVGPCPGKSTSPQRREHSTAGVVVVCSCVSVALHRGEEEDLNGVFPPQAECFVLFQCHLGSDTAFPSPSWGSTSRTLRTPCWWAGPSRPTCTMWPLSYPACCTSSKPSVSLPYTCLGATSWGPL